MTVLKKMLIVGIFGIIQISSVVFAPYLYEEKSVWYLQMRIAIFFLVKSNERSIAQRNDYSDRKGGNMWIKRQQIVTANAQTVKTMSVFSRISGQWNCLTGMIWSRKMMNACYIEMQIGFDVKMCNLL